MHSLHSIPENPWFAQFIDKTKYRIQKALRDKKTKTKIRLGLIVFFIFLVIRLSRPKYSKLKSYKEYKKKHGEAVIFHAPKDHSDEAVANAIIDSLTDGDSENGKENADNNENPAFLPDKNAIENNQETKDENDEANYSEDKTSFEYDATARKMKANEEAMLDDSEGFKFSMEGRRVDYGDLHESLTRAVIHTTLPPEMEPEIDYSKVMSNRQLETRITREKLNDKDKEYIKNLLGLEESYHRKPIKIELTEEEKMNMLDPEGAFRRQFGVQGFDIKGQKKLMEEQRERYLESERQKVKDLQAQVDAMKQELIDTYPIIADKLRAIGQMPAV